MNFAYAAAITAIALLVVSQVQRRTQNDAPWLRHLILVLRVVVLAFVALYLYFKLSA